MDADAKQDRQSAGSGSDASNVSSSSSTSSAGALKPDVVADVVSVDDVAVHPPEPIPVVGVPVRKAGLLRIVCMARKSRAVCFFKPTHCFCPGTFTPGEHVWDLCKRRTGLENKAHVACIFVDTFPVDFLAGSLETIQYWQSQSDTLSPDVRRVLNDTEMTMEAIQRKHSVAASSSGP